MTEATGTLQEVLSLIPSDLGSPEKVSSLPWYRAPGLVSLRDYFKKHSLLFHRKGSLDLISTFESSHLP